MPPSTACAESNSRTRTLVICLGNEHRGDDAFGPRVARCLGSTLEPAARVVAHRGDELALIELWRDQDRVILVDAIAIDRPPGTILHFDVSHGAAPLELGGASTHALGAGGAIEIARALGQLPGKFEIIAVAGSRFDLGAPLTPEVASGVDTVVRQLRSTFR